LYISTRRPDEAIIHLREAVALQSGFSLAHAQLGHAYFQKAMTAPAIAEFEIAARLGAASDKAHLAYGYAMVGRHSEALSILATLIESGRYCPPFHTALAYTGLGDHSEALRWLEHGYEQRDPWMTTLNIDRSFDPLRTGSRFGDIVRRIGLVP
jgi:tetratricopeptide (TPR) repeat protein